MAKFTFNPEISPAGDKQQVANFTAELVSISAEAKENANGTSSFHNCTIKYKNHLDKEVTARAIMPAGNFDYGVEAGKSYLTKVVITEATGDAIIIVSHLENGVTMSASDFGFSVTAVADFSKASK